MQTLTQLIISFFCYLQVKVKSKYKLITNFIIMTLGTLTLGINSPQGLMHFSLYSLSLIDLTQDIEFKQYIYILFSYFHSKLCCLIAAYLQSLIHFRCNTAYSDQSGWQSTRAAHNFAL